MCVCVCVCVCHASTNQHILLLLQLLSAMIGKMHDKDGPLPQDEMEGVEEEEWVSDQVHVICVCHLLRGEAISLCGMV